MKLLQFLLMLAMINFLSCSKSTDNIDGDSDEIEMVDGEDGEWDDEDADVEVADSDDADFSDEDSGDEEDFDLAEGDDDFGDDEFSDEGDSELELADDDSSDELDLDDDDADLELAESDTLEEGELLADSGDEFSIDETEASETDMIADSSIASSDGMASSTIDDGFVDAAPSFPVDDMASSSSMGHSYDSVAMPSGDMGSYTVKANETLMMISFKLYGDYTRWREIASLNSSKLGGGTSISRGMTLAYNSSGSGFSFNPQGSPYLIQRGDTLGTISDKTYGTSAKWKSIWKNNTPLIKDPNKIFAGFTIYLPEDGVRQIASVEPQETTPAPTAMEVAPEPMQETSTELSDDLDADLDDFPEEI